MSIIETACYYRNHVNSQQNNQATDHREMILEYSN